MLTIAIVLPPCLKIRSSGPHLKLRPTEIKRSKRIMFDGKLAETTFLISSPNVALLRIVREMVFVETREL